MRPRTITPAIAPGSATIRIGSFMSREITRLRQADRGRPCLPGPLRVVAIAAGDPAVQRLDVGVAANQRDQDRRPGQAEQDRAEQPEVVERRVVIEAEQPKRRDRDDPRRLQLDEDERERIEVTEPPVRPGEEPLHHPGRIVPYPQAIRVIPLTATMRAVTTTAQTSSLSDAARSFVEDGPKRLLIGGEWVEAADGRTFATIDPATGEEICEVAQAGPEDVDRAVDAAREALERPWRRSTRRSASALIWALADLIKANGAGAGRARDARQRQAARGGARATSPPPSTTCATTPAGRPRSRARRSRSRPATCTATRCASRSASAARSSPGTSRC